MEKENKQGSIVEAVKEVINNQLQQIEELRQETLEEARVNNLIKLFGKDFDLEPRNVIENCNDSFINGAKWQQEQMCSDEIINILDNIRYWDTCPNDYMSIIEQFLEQFKKNQL